jgi:hypothetical protein
MPISDELTYDQQFFIQNLFRKICRLNTKTYLLYKKQKALKDPEISEERKTFLENRIIELKEEVNDLNRNIYGSLANRMIQFEVPEITEINNDKTFGDKPRAKDFC